MGDPRIRDAVLADAGALLAIYSRFVTETAVSFELDPPSVEEFSERILDAQSKWAWLTAEQEGRVVGYAYASSFRRRPAYQWSVEVSAYLSPACRGQGVGRALYERLISVLVVNWYHSAERTQRQVPSGTRLYRGWSVSPGGAEIRCVA